MRGCFAAWIALFAGAAEIEIGSLSNSGFGTRPIYRDLGSFAPSRATRRELR